MNRLCFSVCAALLTAALAASPAFAHRLNIFAWLENDTIMVDCNFGAGHPAKNADVTVYDDTTKKAIVTGKTGDNGYYSFRVPEVVRQGHGLLIDVNAGQGHRGDWTMDASELYAAASLTAGFDAAAIYGANNAPSRVTLRPASGTNDHPDDHAPEATPATVAMPDTQNAVDHADYVRKVVREELASKLGPIHRELARQNSSEPSFGEIVGGIGWIVGIVGIILFFVSRRKS